MFLVIKKTRIIIAVIAIAMILTVAVVAIKVNSVTSATPAKSLPIYGVATKENKIALSFDAAWGGDKTLKIMEFLDTYNVKATFFLVGFWIDEYPELVKEIDKRGHQIGNHSANHPHFNKLSKEQKRQEIVSVNEKISRLTGKTPRFFRAPFGEYNNELIDVCKEINMQCIQWTVDTLDWKGISGKEITNRVLTKVDKGSIILCHNNSDHILDALPIMLLGLKNKNLTSVRMEELVLEKNYNIDNNGIQHSQI